MTADEGKIKLSFVHNNVFVWNPNDVCKLRENHRVVGFLTGCLPRFPMQNNQLGLPLQLLPEETKLLLDKGICCLVDENKPLKPPSSEHVQWFKQLRKTQYDEQIELYREERREEMRRHLPEIIKGRHAKKKRLADPSLTSEESSEATGSDKEVNTFDVTSVSIPAISVQHTMVQLFTETPRRDSPVELVGDWSFPSTEKETLRYHVYRDLWERGYYLTAGTKFGGDFLAYPGDPGIFHACFVAVCVPIDTKMAPLDIVAMGRLGSNVKKTVVMCSFDTDTDSVLYTSLQWSGMS